MLAQEYYQLNQSVRNQNIIFFFLVMFQNAYSFPLGKY